VFIRYTLPSAVQGVLSLGIVPLVNIGARLTFPNTHQYWQTSLSPATAKISFTRLSLIVPSTIIILAFCEVDYICHLAASHPHITFVVFFRLTSKILRQQLTI
jgi:hypothetical protein